MKKQGMLIVVSGFSGVGKGTVVKKLIQKYEQYALSISVTTREPRDGEVDGINYYFKTEEEFEQMVEEGAFLEHALYVSCAYGTPRAFVKENLEAGRDVILEIDIQGARKVLKEYPDTVLIFMVAKDAETIRKRLIERGTESLEVIERRLARAEQEAEGIDEYDYLLVNDDLDTCVEELNNIIRVERRKMKYNIEFAEKIKNEMKALVKGE